MKKAPIGGLLYQEYYLCKKYVRNLILIAVAVSVMALLVLGSFQYGNLRQMSDDIKEMFWDYFLMLGKYGPIYMICTIPESCLELAIKQETSKWRQFRMTLPVSGFRLAAAKYLFSLILLGISVLLAMVYLLFFNRLYPGEFSIGCIGLSLAMLACLYWFGTLMLFYGSLFGSTDKAGVCLLGTILTVFLLVKLFCPNFLPPMPEGTELLMPYLEDLGRKILPAALISVPVSIIAGFVGMGFVYQRREK